jgi:histone deacetylase HOS3
MMSPGTIKSPLGLNILAVEERPIPTASSVAADHFRAELDSHHTQHSSQTTQATVFLHDSCYGHRYSRPRTSRASLSTIVERPERIKASVVGVAMAYVRLGERHAEGMFPIHPKLHPSSIQNLPFRIRKTARRVSLMSPAVTNVHGTKWMEELKIMCDSAETKLAMGGKELQRPEMNRGPDAEAPAKLHEGDLFLCAESLDAFEGALGAVCDAVDSVFSTGPRRAFVAVRPPGHHCSASYPSGFCWINNVHVGLMHAILNHDLTHAAIIDFDLHHGDGSQSIAWQHNSRGNGLPKNAAAWKKTAIGYFSLHDINSYPCEMGDEEKVKNASLCIDNAHNQNIWNVHLEPWKSETEFWKLYESKYSILLEKTRAFLKSQTERLRAAGQAPKAAIFLSAGFDASEWESAGMQRHNVNVPTEFYARLTQDVIRIAAEEGTSVEGRVVSVLEGGYSDRALRSGICSHISGLVGDQTATTGSHGQNGLGYEMGQRLGSFSKVEPVPEQPSLSSIHVYDPAWWSSAQLDALESAMTTPAPEPKKPRHVTPPTYSSPTQASNAKVVIAPRVRRSLSGLSSLGNATPMSMSRAPSPPPPEVHWTTASIELSRLLIPADRPTDSCKHEDLNAEATRARRDRQSLLGQVESVNDTPPAAPAARMALRERKPAKVIESIEEDDEKLAKSRKKAAPSATALSTEKVCNILLFSDTPETKFYP